MAEPPTRLFLITPALADPSGFVEPLGAALAAGDVACLLVRHTARDERDAKALVRTIAAVAHPHGTALLVENDPRVAAHTDADGVHIAGVGEQLTDALERLKPERIVGCGGLALRDDAMLAGETEVDYLMFGEPRADGSPPAREDTLARVQWWAEIFNVPCVGFAQTLADVEPLARTGAEFVALGDAVWADPRGPAAAVLDAWASLRVAAAALEEVRA